MSNLLVMPLPYESTKFLIKRKQNIAAALLCKPDLRQRFYIGVGAASRLTWKRDNNVKVSSSHVPEEATTSHSRRALKKRRKNKIKKKTQNLISSKIRGSNRRRWWVYLREKWTWGWVGFHVSRPRGTRRLLGLMGGRRGWPGGLQASWGKVWMAWTLNSIQFYRWLEFELL